MAARLLHAAGASVAVSDIDGAGAERVAQSLGTGCVGYTLDVTDGAEVRRRASEIEASLGSVDILVNNAFTTTVGRFLDIDPDAVERTIDVVLLGGMNTSRAVLPGMVERGRGRIINVISDAGRTGEPGMAAYSAAKAGLAGFTKALAKEVGPSGITVNGVSPGATRTANTLKQLADMGVDEGALAAAYPLRRLGEPDDIASAILWLASPMAAWVTGQIVSVNGGYAC